jgi:hypothetical protein
VRIAIQSQHHHDHDEFHLPHQGMWFFLMLIVLLLVLSKTVGSSMLMRHGVQQHVDADRVAFN